MSMDLNGIDYGLLNEIKKDEYKGTIQNRWCLISFIYDFLKFDSANSVSHKITVYCVIGKDKKRKF